MRLRRPFTSSPLGSVTVTRIGGGVIGATPPPRPPGFPGMIHIGIIILGSLVCAATCSFPFVVWHDRHVAATSASSFFGSPTRMFRWVGPVRLLTVKL